MCTPTFGGIAYDCDQAEHDKLAATQAEYEEAEAVYASVNRHIESLAAEGKPIDDEVKAVARGAFLKDITKTQQLFIDGTVKVKGHTKVAWWRPLDAQEDGSDLAVTLCTTPGSLVASSGGQRIPDAWIQHSVFLEKRDQNLLVTSVNVSEVDSC